MNNFFILLFYKFIIFSIAMIEVGIGMDLMQPDYYIYTHRKGWIHSSKATNRDKKEVSGYMTGVPRI